MQHTSITAGAETADPIFPALEAQHQLWLAHGAALDPIAIAEETFGFDSPEADAAFAEAVGPCEADTEGRYAVLQVVPTTPAGLLAYLAFVESPEGFSEIDMGSEGFAALIETMRRYAMASEGGGRPVESVKDRISRLARELADALNEYEDGQFHAVVRPSGKYERPTLLARDLPIRAA